MSQYPQTLEDVRAAARALNQIQYFEYFSQPYSQDGQIRTTIPEMVLIALQNGAPIHMGTNSAMQLMENNVSRSLEEKAQEFDLFRAVYVHAKNDLCTEIGPCNLAVDWQIKEWQEFIPALLSDKQAELFKKRRINHYFK